LNELGTIHGNPLPVTEDGGERLGRSPLDLVVVN